MEQTLYRKYRSRSLDEIIGQDHVTVILKQALKQGRIAHAYLLTGPRGIGKTSIARILAHEINQLPYSDDRDHLDIIEIDAASNNGVDDIRELRDRVQLAPVSAPKKIYIIDEVHMLSKPAFNALLKTLEEPPEHVVFILATTDVDKLPATVISRTQRFGLRAIGPDDAIRHLRAIAKKEQITIDDEALKLLAEHGAGSFRDSISLLDQLRSLTDKKPGITAELVQKTLGRAETRIVQQLLTAYDNRDLTQLIALIDQTENSGVPANILVDQLNEEIRRHLAEYPARLSLLDRLLEVTTSPRPRLKLLVALAHDALHDTPTKPKHAALVATPPTSQVATIAALAVEATEEIPDETRVKVASQRSQSQSSFDWQAIVDYARQHYVAIYSVLAKCAGQLDGTQLTIYARNNFYKKKLDDPKHRINLIKCLEGNSLEDLEITTLAEVAPLKDSQAAAVAAIMGGGEEVALNQ